MLGVFTFQLICVIVFFSVIIASITSHLFHGSYTWQYNRPAFYLGQKLFMRIEYALMKVYLKIGSGWLVKHSTFFRKMLSHFISRVGTGEVYTLEECYKIIDALYEDHPHVYVGLRICPCRQARSLYDKHGSNVTDLTFIFSDTPGKKKQMDFTTFISLSEAKRLLKKFDNEGLIHTMFGYCARYMDGSISLAICNCKSNVCIPLDLKLKNDFFHFHDPHNLAIVNQKKCLGVENCGKCLEVCQFDARVKDPSNGKIKIIDDKCFGCGLCLNRCPEKANKIRFLPENKMYFYPNLFTDIKKQHKKLPIEKHPIRLPST